MVGVVKKLIGVVLFLLAVPLTYALPTVKIGISGESNVLKLEYARENGLMLSVHFNCTECEKIVRSTEYLEVYVVKEPQKIIYQDILPVSVYKDRVLIYSLPGEIFESEGLYYVRFSYRALTTLNTEISAESNFTILVTEIEDSALKVLRLSPDLTRETIFRFDRVPYTFRVEVFNTYQEMQYINAKVEILDDYRRIVLSRNINTRISAFQRSFIEIPIDFSIVLPREYILRLSLSIGPYEVYTIERKIVVGEDEYVPVRLYDIKQYPFSVKSGDYVELKLLLQNIEEEPSVVKILLISQDLGIYRESETIEFDAREAKSLSYVIKIPKEVEPKYYSIDIIIQRGVATRKYTYRLYVEGEKPQPVEIGLLKPLKLEVGKEEEFKLVFKSNVESLNEYKLRIYSENAELTYPSTVTVGGKGSIVEVSIKIKPTSQKVSVSIEVYSADGKVIFSTLETFNAKIRLETIYEYVIKALLIIALIILAVILYYSIELRKKKKRKPERAE